MIADGYGENKQSHCIQTALSSIKCQGFENASFDYRGKLKRMQKMFFKFSLRYFNSRILYTGHLSISLSIYIWYAFNYSRIMRLLPLRKKNNSNRTRRNRYSTLIVCVEVLNTNNVQKTPINEFSKVLSSIDLDFCDYFFCR